MTGVQTCALPISAPKPAKAKQPAKQDVKPIREEVKPDTEEQAEIPGDKPGKAVPAPELRKAYQDLKAKHAQLQKEYETFKTAPREDPEKKTLAERLDAAEKRRQALEDDLRTTAYERSQEFKEKWQEPFLQSYQFGRDRTAAFKVTDGEGNIRQGTPEDFDYIMQIQDDDQAAQVVEQMFGSLKGAVIMNMRNKVHELNGHRVRALQQAQQMSGEREKIKTESEAKQKTMLNDMWGKLNTAAQEKYPHWFKEQEGDEEGNNLLRKGYELADKAFLDNGNSPPEELVKVHSALRNRAAAFGRVAYQLKQREARIAELEKELASYKESEPGSGDGSPKKDDGQKWGLDALENYVG